MGGMGRTEPSGLAAGSTQVSRCHPEQSEGSAVELAAFGKPQGEQQILRSAQDDTLPHRSGWHPAPLRMTRSLIAQGHTDPAFCRLSQLIQPEA